MTNTILLDPNNKYVGLDGQLPSRPDFDKELLTAFCKNKTVSENGFNGLPPSMRKLVTLTERGHYPTLAVTIPEIANMSDILLISRTEVELKDGKEFRLDNFKCITKQEQIEIWVKKD